MTLGDTPGEQTVGLADKPDRIAVLLRWAILFVVACILCVAAYAVLAGVWNPPAPRTQSELILATSRAAVEQNKQDGQAWAQLARAQYFTGDIEAAYATISEARKSVEADERPLLWVNNQELDMLIRDGKTEEALQKAETFIKTDATIRAREKEELLAKGITADVDAQAQENQTTIELYLLRATAEMNLKQLDKAVKSYNEALVLAPRASDILSLRGWAKLDQEDREGARQDFEAALRFMPDLESAKAGLEAIESPPQTPNSEG
jgi:tetratricopeptide (TPR) repeat protein